MPQDHSYPRRPPRLLHLHQGTRPFYFVTFNTYKRLPILANDEVHASFSRFCHRAIDHGVAVGRYVVMPDHIHLFAFIAPDGVKLQDWIKALKVTLGKTLLAQGVKKPHWQEGFFDHVLRHSESYSEKWEYVRANPVRAGLVAVPDEWPYGGEISLIRF